MLTHEIPPDFRGGVHLFILNRHTPSGQSRVNRVTQLRTDGVHCREFAGTGPVVLKVVQVTGAAILQVTKDQLMCASLSHIHCWYEEGMLIECNKLRCILVYRVFCFCVWCPCMAINVVGWYNDRCVSRRHFTVDSGPYCCMVG